MSPESKYPILLSFYDYLNKFNSLIQEYKYRKTKKQLCMIIPQDYTISILKSILINTMLFQMLEK